MWTALDLLKLAVWQQDIFIDHPEQMDAARLYTLCLWVEKVGVEFIAASAREKVRTGQWRKHNKEKVNA